MNPIYKHDEHGAYYACGICLESHDDITSGNACCTSLFPVIDMTIGRVITERKVKPSPFPESIVGDEGITA